MSHLILSRYVGQSIVIGQNITVTIKSIDRHGRVAVGVVAPPNVPVDRTEIRIRKEESKR